MSRDDTELFRELMKDVAPIKNDEVAFRPNTTPDERAEARRKAAEAAERNDPAAGLSEHVKEWVEPEGIISWKKDGVQDGVFRQLKRGQYTVQASLILHQMRVTEARNAVAQFITDCYQRGVRNALIMHGMGKQSTPRPALLKSLCNQWLPELSQVLAFHTADKSHGGAGATFVMIKKNADAKILNKERNRRR